MSCHGSRERRLFELSFTLRQTFDDYDSDQHPWGSRQIEFVFCGIEGTFTPPHVHPKGWQVRRHLRPRGMRDANIGFTIWWLWSEFSISFGWIRDFWQQSLSGDVTEYTLETIKRKGK